MKEIITIKAIPSKLHAPLCISSRIMYKEEYKNTEYTLTFEWGCTF